MGTLKLYPPKFPGGYLEDGQADQVSVRRTRSNGERDEIIEFGRGEKFCIDKCAGRIEPDDVTPYQAFGDFGILNLFAQRNNTAGLQ